MVEFLKMRWNFIRIWWWESKTAFMTGWDTMGWKPGQLYEDCSYRKLKLVSISWDGSMLGEDKDGHQWSCSFYHCGPVKIDEW